MRRVHEDQSNCLPEADPSVVFSERSLAEMCLHAVHVHIVHTRSGVVQRWCGLRLCTIFSASFEYSHRVFSHLSRATLCRKRPKSSGCCSLAIFVNTASKSGWDQGENDRRLRTGGKEDY